MTAARTHPAGLAASSAVIVTAIVLFTLVTSVLVPAVRPARAGSAQAGSGQGSSAQDGPSRPKAQGDTAATAQPSSGDSAAASLNVTVSVNHPRSAENTVEQALPGAGQIP